MELNCVKEDASQNNQKEGRLKWRDPFYSHGAKDEANARSSRVHGSEVIELVCKHFGTPLDRILS